MRDFTRDRPEIQFKIDNDIFKAIPALPARVIVKLAAQFEELSDKDSEAGFEATVAVIDTLLDEESAVRFRARLEAGAEHAIDVEQVAEVMQWLLGEYGMRPTEPSEPSSIGLPSPVSGMNSTASTSDVVSISSVSLPPTS